MIPARNTQHNRPLLRFSIAVLAVMANVVLPTAKSQASAVSHLSGDTFSLCLANGSNNTPTNRQSDNSGAVSNHCNLCLLGGATEAPTTGAVVTPILHDIRALLSYGHVHLAVAPQFRALPFKARAPPA